MSGTFLILRRIQKISQTYEGLHVRSVRYTCHSLRQLELCTKLELCRQIFEKILKYQNFHGNPTSGRRIVPRGQINMAKLIVAYRIFANALNKGALLIVK